MNEKALTLTLLLLIVGCVMPGKDAGKIGKKDQSDSSLSQRDSNTVGRNVASSTFYGKSLFKDPHLDSIIKLKDPSYTQTVIPGEFRSVNGTSCPLITHTFTGSTDNMLFQNISNANPSSTNLAQWDSSSNLIDGTSEYRYDFHSWSDGKKEFELTKLDKNSTAIRMKIIGQSEIGTIQENNDPCKEKRHPQLLLERSPKAISIGKMNSLRLNLNLKRTLEYLPRAALNNWDRSKSTAHFLIHINIQNKTGTHANNPGFGQGFGIGINLYDARNSQYQDWSFIHKPQQRLIRYISPNRLSYNFTNNLHGGRAASMNVDLIGHITAAFNKAITEGKKSNSHAAELHSEDLDDYYVTSVNMGWENSSLHNVEMEINKYALDYEYTDNSALSDSIIETEIKESFKRILGRNITSTHLTNLLSQVQTGGQTINSIEQNFINSPENIEKSIKALYLKYLNRSADVAGLNHNKSLIQQGSQTLGSVERNFKISREYLAREISLLYVTLLRRAADENGLNNFISKIQRGELTLNEVRSAILNSDEYRNNN